MTGVSDMNVSDKNYLIDKLTETHATIQKSLEGVDLELPIYSDTNWRIRDILGHIATWDWEIVKSLQAFQAGSEYIIPGIEEDESDFNELAVSEQRALSTEQILTDWKQARKDLLAAISEIPVEMFPGDLIFPWGDESGSIRRLMEYFIEHDEEHLDEILKVLNAF
jgi:hypothetical protein